MILAGDIGGTNARLALFNGDRQRPVRLDVYSSAAGGGLPDLIEEFLDCDVTVDAACFAVAGTVRDGRAEGVNLDWPVDAREVAPLLGLDSVGVINDLEANAYGIAALARGELEALNPDAVPTDGNAALLSAGTGLGQAGLYSDGSGYRPFATEGGHTDFGPRDETEIELLRYLAAKYGHVSYERICSGRGLADVHAFLSGAFEATLEPAAITEAALDGSSEVCSRALDVFASVYGAQAGNFALSVMAVGGVYLGGGIAPKILPRLRERFMPAFVAKGRFQPLLERIPVRVILNDKAALLGAARHAANGGLQ